MKSILAMLKLGAALTLMTGLMGCAAGQSPWGQADQDAPAEQGHLTVVEGSGPKPNQGIVVKAIHRLEGANIEQWLSDDELQISMTKLIKPGTSTEEPKYEYSSQKVNLDSNKHTAVTDQVDSNMVRKEQVSPDGQYSFIQQWQDKYTARNFIENRGTGQVTVLHEDNYLEQGSWLNNDTYVLAAGSMQGPGPILSIHVDGTITPLPLQDPELDNFTSFGAVQDRIYYTDNKGVLKQLQPGAAQPTKLLKNVVNFELSPDGKHLAVETTPVPGQTGSELRMFDSNGSAESISIAKGDLIPYIAWSPDSTKLAAALYTEDSRGMNGVYILDSTSGKVSPIGLNYFPQFPLSWNPSGTRLGVTIDGEDGLPMTQIVDFK